MRVCLPVLLGASAPQCMFYVSDVLMQVLDEPLGSTRGYVLVFLAP